MTRRKALALMLPSLLLGSDGFLLGSDGFAVVTKKTNAQTITKAQLKKLLLGLGATWHGGGKITLILGPSGEPSRAAALRELAGMTEADFGKNLIHLTFTGESENIPMALPSTAGVRQVVQLNDKAVGIIPLNEVNDSVRVVTFD